MGRSIQTMSQPNETDIPVRVAATVDAWKRKLLDLSRRNRALHFQPVRVATITVIDERPGEVFRRLYLRELPVRFRALDATRATPAVATRGGSAAEPAFAEFVPAEIGAARAAGSGPEIGPRATPAFAPVGLPAVTPPDYDDEPVPAPAYVPYDSEAPLEAHADDWLQTDSSPEALDKSLRRLAEVARSSLEEQGVNTLYLTLGQLDYQEADEAREVLHAPLVMLPVALARKSARAGYVLHAADEDPLVNPALVELLRRNFGVILPELPASDAMADDYDLHGFFAEVAKRIGRRPGWSVQHRVHLAPFSFQKFVMYKDLEANCAAAVQHRLIRQLATRAGGAVVGLPPDVRHLDLDKAFAPEETFQIVDADGSQLRALAAVAHAHDLVIEGPPGTGKSQTITNLIATSLAAGKTVLFVAEKMAALQVVHRRLVAAGLGEFCLELHSTKASKRAVMAELTSALEASQQPVAAPVGAAQRLPVARAAVNDYVHAAHAPFAELGLAPFHAYEEFAAVRAAPRLPYEGPVETVGAAQLDTTVRQLRALAIAVHELGNPAQHPWRDATRTVYLPTDLEGIEELATALTAALAPLRGQGPAIAAHLGLPAIETFADVGAAAEVAALFARSPGAPLAVLQDPAWAHAPGAATALIERGAEWTRLHARLTALFTEAVFDQEHADDIAYIERKAQGARSLFARLDARYRAIRRRWRDYRATDYPKSLVEQAADLRLVDRLQREREALRAHEATAREWFGEHWRGERSDWGALTRYLAWIAEFHRARLLHRLTPRAAEIAAQPAPDIRAAQQLQAAASLARGALAKLGAAVGWPDGYLGTESFSGQAARAEALVKHLTAAPRWAAFAAARQTVAHGIAASFLDAAHHGRLGYDDLDRAFLRAFHAAWIAAALRARPLLEKFNAAAHEQRVAEFRTLDEQVLVENRSRLVARLREGGRARLQAPEAAAGLPVLRREMARQRGHQPLRRTLREAEAAVRAIKPCFLMSPLTVAQYLDGRAPGFDLVIFDEASQLPAEEAAGAIIRGRQLVVVGDPKQLPPTSFFAVTGLPAATGGADDEGPPAPDPESVLEEFMGAGMPMSRLKWHYRSTHESLIQFANASFYEGDLCVFPSAAHPEGTGLQFEFVEGGVYEGKGLNAAEARRVAGSVVAFARRQLERRARGEPMRSLGVGTFNLRQQLAIQDELEAHRRADPRLEPFFEATGAEPFFVKNLENIQGDERDVIFLSVTYAHGPDGKLRQNFGPLNGDNGWRRLNVITTRARQRMRVFASMRGDDISVDEDSVSGARLLRAFLIYAERGQLDGATRTMVPAAPSDFVADVARELAGRGVQVRPQVGVSSHRVSLGVGDDELPGRFVCGIECDDPGYLGAESARDRDRLRPQVLEARGWTIFRAWSTGWFLDRRGQLDRLMTLIEQARRRARQQREAERLAREQAAREAAAREAEGAERARHDAEEARRLAQTPYKRPVAENYQVTPGAARHAGMELLAAPESQLVEAVLEVIECEAPIHTNDLCARVAERWSTRVGARIQERILAAAATVERGKLVRRHEAFWWRADGRCAFRSRAGVPTPPDRIAPEEYAAAITAVLARGHGFSADQLVAELRSVLGYPRTTAAFDEVIRSVVAQLLEDGRLREGTTGIKLRLPPDRRRA